jgi:hypothetical protein
MRKRRGDKGHPYLKPLLDMKNLEVAPLIKTTKDIILIQLITQMMKGTLNPRFTQKVFLKGNHFTIRAI